MKKLLLIMMAFMASNILKIEESRVYSYLYIRDSSLGFEPQVLANQSNENSLFRYV